MVRERYLLESFATEIQTSREIMRQRDDIVDPEELDRIAYVWSPNLRCACWDVCARYPPPYVGDRHAI